MSERVNELRAALLRQRRFLILMSLAVIAAYVLGVSVKEEASYNGFVLTLGKPERVIVGIWIIWGWSLWRYSQRVYEVLSELWAELLEDVYAEDRRIALALAKKVGNKLASDGHFKEDMSRTARIDGRVRIEPPSGDTLQSVLGETVTHFRDYVPTRDGGRLYPTLQADFEWKDGSKWGRTDNGFKMTLTRGQSAWLRIRAWLHSLLRLPAFSEHVAPLLIAATAVVTWLIHRGSSGA